MNSIQSYILEHLFDVDSENDLYKVGDKVTDTEIIKRIEDNYICISNNEVPSKSIIINPENINKYISIENYFHPKKIFLYGGKYFSDATIFNGHKIDGKDIEIRFPGCLRLDCHQLKNISIDGSTERKEGLLSIEQGTAMMKFSNVQITGFSRCECKMAKFTQFDNKCKFAFDELKFPKQCVRVNAPKCFNKYEDEKNIFSSASVEISKEDLNELFDALNINSKQFKIWRIRFVDDNDFEFTFLRKGFKWYYVYANSIDFYKHFGKSQ